MTQTPAESPATTVRPGPDTATRVLVGLALVLAAMAAALLVSGLLVSPLPSSTDVCTADDTSMGECLLAVRMGRLHDALVLHGAVMLAAGAVTSAVAASVLRGRRR
jgi:hypothetical protein